MAADTDGGIEQNVLGDREYLGSLLQSRDYAAISEVSAEQFDFFQLVPF